MANEFDIDAYRKGREIFVLLRGRLVLSCCQDAKMRLANLLTTQIEVFYLSMAELTFLDSAGLGVMVGLKMNSNKNRTRLVLLSPPHRIQDIFRVSKLDTIFEIRSSAEADVIAASLMQPEYCLWRNSKDIRQGQCNTVGDFEPKSNPEQLIQAGGENISTDTRVLQLCDQAVSHIRQGDYPMAIDCYQHALRLDPENLSSLNNLAIVYEKQPELYALAIEAWSQLLELSERRNDDKHANRARKHLETLTKLVRPA